MRLMEVNARLQALNQAALTTADAAACLRIEKAHASKILARLSETGGLVFLRRGLWAFKDRVEPLMLPQILAAPFPAYVSMYSALFYHGMISQIPVVLYAASVHRTRKFVTKLGAVSIHHLDADFFFGFEPIGNQGAQMAVPEKALLDVLYLAPTRTRLFTALPEIEIPSGFSRICVRKMVSKIRSVRRRNFVAAKLEHLIS